MTEPRLHLTADLRFSSTAADGSEGLSGTVTADGSTIHVWVSGPIAVSGKTSRGLVRHVAAGLAKRHLRLVVHDPQGMVVALGDVRTLRWQRFLTRSPHIRFGKLRDLRRIASRSPNASRDLAFAATSPPPTLLPFFPTVSTLGPRYVTTTHDPRGGGRPRVIFVSKPLPPDGTQRVEYLTQQQTTFGSSVECDVQIAGLEPVHAVIERTDADEYVLTHVADSGTSTVAGAPAQQSLLRTGVGITLGNMKLSYFREEYADHGRPYGGRLGGEIGYQRPQPTPQPRTPGSVGRPRTNQQPGRYYP